MASRILESTVLKVLRPVIYYRPESVTLLDASECLGLSRMAFIDRMKNDADFPKPYYKTSSATATQYFKYSELEEWHRKKKSY